MRRLRDWRLQTAAGLLGGILAVGTPVASVASAHTQTTAGAHALQTGPVSPVPANGTPALAPTGSTAEQVRQIVQCGTTMYAVGTFTQLSQSGTTVFRNNVFSFSASSPYTILPWNPDVNGLVDSIALSPDCADAYIGGTFTAVGGTAVHNIAEIDTTNGTVVPGFGHSASGEVDTLLLANGHLLTGGAFKTINGSSADPYYASLSPMTGQDDGYLHLNISGHYVYPGVIANATSVYNQQLSPLGDAALVEGTFTSVGGQSRQQIFMLGLGASSGTVTAWDSPEFHQFCGTKHPFYIKAAAWSPPPDESTVYIATTGKAPFGWNGKFPLTGLCDMVAAFPATQAGGLTHEWINYTGCDSLFSVAADTSAVYVGGHERWADNPNGCNAKGHGGIPAQGMGGFTPGPSGGSLLLNSAGTAGLYSRGRGEGADDMLLTSAGLWIASDNFAGVNQCGGVSGHAGICFLPYP
jgi:hypothetical protein